MQPLIRDFAGAPRAFCLRTGEIVDLEQACGKIGIGLIYQRFGGHMFHVTDLIAVLKYALIGGGMPTVEADQLVRTQVEVKPLFELSGLANDILIELMAGLPVSEGGQGDPEKPIDLGPLFGSLIQLGVTPDQLRAMRYDDLVALLNATGKSDLAPPTEEEFEAMLQAWEESGADRAT